MYLSTQCNSAGDACDCSDPTYYYQDRTCKKVPPPDWCYAYWLKNDTNGQKWVKYEWAKAPIDSDKVCARAITDQYACA